MEHASVIEIANIAQGAQAAADKTVVINGTTFSSVRLHDQTPELHGPKLVKLHSLQGLVGYLKLNRDKIVADEAVVHVESPTLVSVFTGTEGPRNQRFQYAHACAVDAFPEDGRFVPPDEFTIALKTLFAESEDRDKIVALAGNVSADQSAHLEDDGFTQKVTVKGGVTLVGEQQVPNPVTLAPYRTFREVEQPASPFLVRFRGGGDSPVACALFAADAGTWKLEAIKNVVKWLADELPEGFEVIG